MSGYRSRRPGILSHRNPDGNDRTSPNTQAKPISPTAATNRRPACYPYNESLATGLDHPLANRTTTQALHIYEQRFYHREPGFGVGYLTTRTKPPSMDIQLQDQADGPLLPVAVLGVSTIYNPDGTWYVKPLEEARRTAYITSASSARSWPLWS